MNTARIGSPFIAHLRCFAADQRGATMIEYGLIVSAVSVAMMGALFAAGEELNSVFGKILAFFTAFTA